MMNLRNATLLRALVVTMIPIWTVLALVFIRLIGPTSVVPVTLTSIVAYLLSSLILLCSSRLPVASCGWLSSNPFWVITVTVMVNIIAFHVLGIIGAAYGGLRVVSGPQYMVVAGLILTVVSRAGLRPDKAW